MVALHHHTIHHRTKPLHLNMIFRFYLKCFIHNLSSISTSNYTNVNYSTININNMIFNFYGRKFTSLIFYQLSIPMQYEELLLKHPQNQLHLWILQHQSKVVLSKLASMPANHLTKREIYIFYLCYFLNIHIFQQRKALLKQTYKIFRFYI